MTPLALPAMTHLFQAADNPARGADLRGRAMLFALWLALALYFVATHVMWRDEVRALTLALSGDSVVAMLRTIHGEGHPAIWYLLLRGAHALVPVREVLPAMGAIIGAGAAAMLAFRAPFRLLVIALALLGEWLVFEYTAVARNYGISALLLFVFADRYARWRSGARGWAPGLALALLCNTNVPSVLLAAGLLLFWLIDVVTVDGWRWTPALSRWAIAAGCAAVGVAICFATVYPPYQDAAVSPLARDLGPAALLRATTRILPFYGDLLPPFLWQWRPVTDGLLALAVIALPLGLARAPGGLAAGTAVTLALLLFFQFVYPGGYRHVALLIAFVLALHWMIAKGGGGRWPARWRAPAGRIAAPAAALFALLLATHVGYTAPQLALQLQGGVYSHSADLGRLLHRPDLRRAIVMSNSDVLLEPIGYYAPNPIWLTRQKRFGRVVRFTHFADRDLSLDTLLATARALRRRTGRPIVILLHEPLNPTKPQSIYEGFDLTFSTTPRQVRDFEAATVRLAGFDRSQLDENYEVYVLG